MNENKFEKILKAFFNSNFPINEKNLNKFLNKLRKYDFKNIYNKPFSYSIDNDLTEGSYTDYTSKEVCIAYTANRLLHAKNFENVLDAYKANFLMSFYHEQTHEEQYERYIYSQVKNKQCDEYSQLINFDLTNLISFYNPLTNLIEIDARYNSVKRMVADIKSGRVEEDKNMYPFMLCEIFNMLKGINNSEVKAEFQQHQFNAYRILEIYEENNNKLKQFGFPAIKIDEKFKQNFTKIFEEKMYKFFENEYKFVVSKVIENYAPSKAGYVYLTSKWKERVNALINNPTQRDLWVLTTDSVNLVKNQAQDFTYRKSDLDEFLLRRYHACNQGAYMAFKNDKQSHKSFEEFLLRKHLQTQDLENKLL